MNNKKHKRNKAYAPKKPTYVPKTKEEIIREVLIVAGIVVVIVGLILWNKFAPWDGSLPQNSDHDLLHISEGETAKDAYPGKLITNMDSSSILSHRKYYITAAVNGAVEGYTEDKATTIRSDRNTTDFYAKPDEGTDSPFAYYYISTSNKTCEELSSSVYEQMSGMYAGYISELEEKEFDGKTCKCFSYLYDASHDEVEETEGEAEDAVTEEATPDLAQCAVCYFPASRNTTVIIQTPVKVDNDPANFVDEQVMYDLIAKIVPTVDFMN